MSDAGASGEAAPGPDPRRDLPAIPRSAVLLVALDAVVFGMLALGVGGSHLDALVALIVGGAFALLVVARARRSSAGSLPVDEA